ncbi:MAG TPA: hypothetical protein VFB07_06665 [Vicinamibacterales bacterium]|nr:hypothetical protein [Vicinamibacterales bacterium]
MTVQRWVAAAVTAAIVGGALPTVARAEEPAQPAGERGVSLRASIERAAARAAANQAKADAATARQPRVAMMQTAGGGGGGHVMMVVTLLSTVAGLATTYYVIKQMQKTTSEIPQPGK